MDIQKWQKSFVVAINKKYPRKFTKEQRLLAIYRQLADVSKEAQYGGDDLKHRIAAVFADLFMLCDDCDVDLNEELVSVLEWFNSNGRRR